MEMQKQFTAKIEAIENLKELLQKSIYRNRRHYLVVE